MPDDLAFEFKPVPDEENAIMVWRRAGGIEVAENDKQWQAIKFCWTPMAKQASPETLDDLNVWLKRNQPALELFDASLTKPKAQWPERKPQNRQPETSALSVLMRARLLIADQLAEQNKFESAVASLEGSLKLSQLGIEGDPGLLQYYVASRTRTLTQDAILRLAARRQMPLPLLERLLNDLPGLDSETNIYANILRVEFTSEFNSQLDIKKLAEDWSGLAATNAALLLFPEECRRPLKVLLDPFLVSFHPKPLDWNLEMEKSMRQLRIYRANVLSPWADRDDEVGVESVENRTNLMADIAPLMKLVETEPLPLSRAAAQRARTAYLEIENPIGRILACSITDFMSSDVRVFRVRTEREATRAVLALQIFEREKGILPEKLSDLVDAKILKTVPADPFSGGPLLYSRKHGIVWSVGEDGTDNNGTAGKFRWSGDDAVWQIPESN